MRTAIAVLAAIVFLGCAVVKVYPIKNTTGSSGRDVKENEPGVRFYRPALHVWITAAAPPDKVNTEKVTTGAPPKTTETITSLLPKAFTAQLVMLPDLSKEFIVQWRAGIGTARPKVTLSDGWNLTNIEAETQQKVVEAVTSLGGLFTELVAKDPNFKGAGLYRMEFVKDKGWKLGEQVMSLE